MSTFCNIAPEELALIEKGALHKDRTVARGWIERYTGSIRKLVPAPTFGDVVFGYRNDRARMVHSISLDPGLVLDTPEMDRLRNTMNAATFGDFHDEWRVYVAELFNATFKTKVILADQ